MQKCTENTATDRITSREFNPVYIYVYNIYVFINIYTYIYNIYIYIYYIYTGLYSREYNPIYIYIYIYIYTHIYINIYIYIYIYIYIFPQNPSSNNKYCSTAGSRTMYELLRTVKFYSQNFMFFLKTSSKLCFYFKTFTGNFYPPQSYPKIPLYVTILSFRIFSSQS